MQLNEHENPNLTRNNKRVLSVILQNKNLKPQRDDWRTLLEMQRVLQQEKLIN